MNTAEQSANLWHCLLCAWHYDEALGAPELGIAPGTPWDQVPEDLICPECGADKSVFEPLAL